jgi:hypothetical protein
MEQYIGGIAQLNWKIKVINLAGCSAKPFTGFAIIYQPM